MSRTWSLGPRLIFTTGALVAALLSEAVRPSVASAQTLPGSSLPNPSVALRIGQADGARSGADFDEFRGDASETPVHVVGSNDLTTVRAWVGHSTCCTPGRSKYQTFTFRGLDPSLVYAFYVYPSYLTGSRVYRVTSTSGGPTILNGSRHVFQQNAGYFSTNERWEIVFRPASGEASFSIGNDLVSGTHYLALDYYELTALTTRNASGALVFAGSVQIGEKDLAGLPGSGMELFTSWDELQSGSLTGTYRWGTSTPADLRDWLGHSDCGGCQPGYAKRQRLTFIGLVPGQSYTLTVGLAYVIGEAYYAAYVVEGQADLLAGQQKAFGGKVGALTPADDWVIRFTARSASVTLELGHGLTSGAHYLYVDDYVFKSDPPPPPVNPSAFSGTLLIGDKDLNAVPWDEFGSEAVTATYTVGGSGLADVRPWIGHSDCGACAPGTAKRQRFTIPGLVPGRTYSLTAGLAYVAGSAYYDAYVVGGEARILAGQRKEFGGKTGYLSATDTWIIVFEAQTSSVTLELGHGLTAGAHYLYLDYYSLSEGNATPTPAPTPTPTPPKPQPETYGVQIWVDSNNMIQLNTRVAGSRMMGCQVMYKGQNNNGWLTYLCDNGVKVGYKGLGQVFRVPAMVFFVDGVPPYVIPSIDGQDLFGVPGFTSVTSWANHVVNALYGP